MGTKNCYMIEKNINFFSKNQNVDLKTTDEGFLRLELQQGNSTPGVLLRGAFFQKGTYEITITAETSAHNVFGIVLFTEDLKMKKVRISQKLPLGFSENSAVFEISEDMHLVPAVLASLGKVGDILVLEDFRIDLRETSENEREELTNNTYTDLSKNEGVPQEPQSEIATSVFEAQVLQAPKSSCLHFFVGKAKFGIGTFVRELSKIMPVNLIENESDAEEILSRGLHLFVNGFVKKTEDLAYRYPQQIHCFWHSSLKGIELMGEMQRYYNFLEAIARDVVFGYFLNEKELLPIKGRRFWLPFEVQTKESTNQKKVDFALPLASPHSLSCKNVFEIICNLLQKNYSFVMPAWYENMYQVEILKKAFNSESYVSKFETKENPIEMEYFQGAKVYLSLSNTDTMPYACVEAVNAGTPFFATKNVGWARYLEDLPKNAKCIFGDVNDLEAIFSNISKQKGGLNFLLNAQKKILIEVSEKNKGLLIKQFFEAPKVTKQRVTMKSVTDPAIVLFCLGVLRKNHFLKIENVDISTQNEYVELAVDFVTCETNSVDPSLEGMERLYWFIDIYEKLFFEADSYESKTWEIQQAVYALIDFFYAISKKGKLKRKDADMWAKCVFLGIDRVGWAFDNISKQVVKATTHAGGLHCIKVEYFFVLLILKVFEIKTNIVCFWWRSKDLLQNESPDSNVALMLYDHYSWSNATQDLVDACRDVVCVGVANNQLKQDLLSLGIKKPIFVVKDGVDLDIFPIKKESSNEGFTFGWIGNAKIQKSAGFDGTDFKGFSLIKEVVSKSDFHLKYIDVSETKPVPHTEVFDRFYSQIDCYICASESEGTPNTVFESLACGIPVITTNVGNVSDVVVDGFNGKIIERNTESLEKAMYEIVERREYFKNNTQKIRDSVQLFDWKIRVLAWCQLLDYLTNVVSK